MDAGHVSLLALFDVSSAFDSVDHSILLQRLSTSFGLTDKSLEWLRSFLSERTNCVTLILALLGQPGSMPLLVSPRAQFLDRFCTLSIQQIQGRCSLPMAYFISYMQMMSKHTLTVLLTVL